MFSNLISKGTSISNSASKPLLFDAKKFKFGTLFIGLALPMTSIVISVGLREKKSETLELVLSMITSVITEGASEE